MVIESDLDYLANIIVERIALAEVQTVLGELRSAMDCRLLILHRGIVLAYIPNSGFIKYFWCVDLLQL